jgi:hypothetical protein
MHPLVRLLIIVSFSLLGPLCARRGGRGCACKSDHPRQFSAEGIKVGVVEGRKGLWVWIVNVQFFMLVFSHHVPYLPLGLTVTELSVNCTA